MSLGIGGIVSLGGGSQSGSSGGGGSTSGIIAINGQLGPFINIVGLSGITILSAGNFITIIGPGSGSSSVSKFAATFSSITSGLFVHNLNSLDVLVQVFDAPGGGAKNILPDDIIIEDSNSVSLIFNTPQDGKVVII